MGDHARAAKVPPWTNCPLKAMLASIVDPGVVRKFMHLWFFHSTSTADQVTDNFSGWASKADLFSKTIARHYSNTPLLGALDQGGLTPNVFDNTAKILHTFLGTHVLKPIFSDAVGDRVRRINLSGVSQLVG